MSPTTTATTAAGPSWRRRGLSRVIGRRWVGEPGTASSVWASPGARRAGGIARLESRGDEVIGLSRSTGYDLKDRERIVAAVAGCDVFVNNRHQYNDDTQLQLLFRLAELWKGQDKTIVNLGSRAGEVYLAGRCDPYSVYKHALDAACQQLFNRADQRPRVVNIRPGFVDTDSVKARQVPKLTPRDIANVVMWVIEQPSHVYISSVTLAHHVTQNDASKRSNASRFVRSVLGRVRALRHAARR